jgi:hypothetical protein
MDRKKYEAKGNLLFRIGILGLETQLFDRDFYLDYNLKLYETQEKAEAITDMFYRDKFSRDIYDLFDGDEFLQMVEDGCIIDYDGHIVDIFVDGYKSNLGLATDNLTQGEFLVNTEVWKELCKNFNIEVNWANK